MARGNPLWRGVPAGAVARTFFVVGLGLGAVQLAAQSGLEDDEMKIRGVFNSSLPGTQRKNSLRLTFHPRVGDVLKRDHVRVPLGLRYGLTKDWEIAGALEGYFSHGLGDAAWFDRSGLSKAGLSTKYRLGQVGQTDWDSAVGLDFSTPIGDPPSEITDGLRHYSPYVTFSRRLESDPRWRIFWNVGTDLVSATDIPGQLDKNELGADSASLTAGTVFDRGPWHYTLEAELTSTRPFGGPTQDVFALRPGLLWEVPERFTGRVGGKWVVGVGLRASFGPDGTDVGGSAKVRVNFDFKRWWRGKFGR
jgi:hypothetical protein